MSEVLKKMIVFLLANFVLNFSAFCQGNNLIAEKINRELETIFNIKYEVVNIFDVNSEIGIDLKNERGYYPINDPYHTLSDCYIFYANSKSINQGDVVGIYKNSIIIWVSKPYFYGERTELVGTIDMNLDGNVEIILALKIWGAAKSFDDIFIFSWDGKIGNCINDRDSDDNLIPIGMSSRTFTMDDLNGDGILEIRSNEKKDGSLTWSWNGKNYGQWDTSPIVPFDVFLPAASAKADVNCKVSHRDDIYMFNYEVFNKHNSKRRIQKFHIEHGLYDLNGSAPFGWKYGHAVKKTPASWVYDLSNTANLILPGQSKKGFIIESFGLPKIINFYIQSERGSAQYNGDDVLIKMHNDIINNSFKGKTIAPFEISSPFIPINFIDTLKNYNTQSYELGWIKEEPTLTKYNNYLTTAKNYLIEGDSTSARNELQLVINDCVADSSTVLTSEAFALLYFNTEYLISQLPEG